MSHLSSGQKAVDEKIPTTACLDGDAAVQPSPAFRSQWMGEGVPEIDAPGPPGPLIADSNEPSNLGGKCSQHQEHKQERALSSPSHSREAPESFAPSSTAGNLGGHVSVDDCGNTYPEGGLRAWMVVYGSFSGMTASFGLMNTIGTYQAYLSTHQLAHLDPSTTGWVFSFYTFLSFFCGVQIGPFFDNKGPRALVAAGTLCLVVGVLGAAESTGQSNRWIIAVADHLLLS